MQAHQWEPGFSFSFGCSPLKTSLRTKYRMQRNMKNEYSVQGLPPRVRKKKGVQGLEGNKAAISCSGIKKKKQSSEVALATSKKGIPPKGKLMLLTLEASTLHKAPFSKDYGLCRVYVT